MKITEQADISRSQWEHLINEWIFNEEHRKILKFHLLDGYTYEQISDICCLSVRQVARILQKSKPKLFKKLK